MHTANITLIDPNLTRGDKRFYEVVTAHSQFCTPFTSEAYTSPDEDHKIVRWVSNDSVIPQDIAEAAGWAYQDEMNEARDRQSAAAIEQYIKAQANRTPDQIAEEEFEMRAAFGPGTEVVNIFTGKRTKL